MHPWSVFSVFTPSMPSSPSCSPVFCSKNDALTSTKKLCFQVLQLKCHLFHKLVILLCYYSLTAHLSILLSQTQEMGVFAHLVWKYFWYWVSAVTNNKGILFEFLMVHFEELLCIHECLNACRCDTGIPGFCRIPKIPPSIVWNHFKW
jgi:hypothetical protein